jgi:hypothetical protein
MKHPDRTARRFRCINAVVAAVLLVAFLAHAVLTAALGMPPIGAATAIGLLYALAALTGVHVIISLVTSTFMLSDTNRPPSGRKKRHLALKWATGATLLVAGYPHVTHAPLFAACTWLVPMLLLGALAWHGWTGAKSLARDLGMSGSLKTPLRIGLCLVAAAAAALVFAGRA